MDVNILSLQKLFAHPVRYEIPRFQRPYIWDHERQWGPLWEDIQNIAEQCLDPATNGLAPSEQGHFLGAIVLQQQPVPTSMLETRLVVDGQQRLTTLQLLLDAAQEVFEKCGDDNAAKRLELLVLNQTEFRGNNPDHAFKVWPTMTDQESFRYAMRNNLSSEEYKESPIVQAHEFFKLQIREWLANDPQVRTGALEHALKDLLKLVVIDLDQSDDPHVIFETLNARGTPLLNSDLIKNMVLYEAERTGHITDDSKNLDQFWKFDDGFWREEIRQGRLLRPRIDAFLNYWLIMRMRKEIAMDEVFPEFRRYYENGEQAIEETVADMHSVGRVYRELEETSNSDIETFIYRWRAMQMGVQTPVLLWLLSSKVPPQQIKKGLLALESYTVRRMVCRKSSMGHNRLMIRLVDLLEESGENYAGDTIVKYLKEQETDSGLWPEDHDFEDAFINQPLYRLLTRTRLRMLLEGIEEELRTEKTESQVVTRGLTIEHVMPQDWRKNWPSPKKMENEEDAEEKRSRLIHSIGNLTLVNDRLNPSLSNAPWHDKRVELNEHSTLFLNKTLIDNAPQIWDEAAILERAKSLYQEAIKVWPYADKI